MKILVFNLLFAFIWIFFVPPVVSLWTSFFVYPILFILSAYLIGYDLSGFIVVPCCFILILLNDFLLESSSDALGRDFRKYFFYLTIFTTTTALCFVMMKCTKYVNHVNNLTREQTMEDVGFVLFCSIIVFLFFRYVIVPFDIGD